MMKLPTKLKLLFLIMLGGSEFVLILILPPDIFIGSVEDLTLHFLMDNLAQGKLSGSTVKYPTSISIFGPFGHSGQ